MRAGRHITQKVADLQRVIAQTAPRAAWVGVFLPVTRLFARPPAGIGATFAEVFAQAFCPVMVKEPKQPFRPFWLLFWPQNLTGQLRSFVGELPAFGRNFPHIFNVLCKFARCAISRRDLPNSGRFGAHDKRTDGTILDADRCLSKVAISHADRSKGAPSCVNPSLPLFLPELQPCPPVATRRANRHSMAQAPVLPVQPCSTATWSPVRPSVPLVTSSIVRKTRAAAKATGVAAFHAATLTNRDSIVEPSPWVSPMRGGFALSLSRLTHRPFTAPQGTAHV